MSNPKRPNTLIVAGLPEGDRRPTLVRPLNTGAMFGGWGPKL
jgi:hypothetical protein